MSGVSGLASLSITKRQGRFCAYLGGLKFCLMDLIKLKLLHEETSEILIIAIKYRHKSGYWETGNGESSAYFLKIRKN